VGANSIAGVRALDEFVHEPVIQGPLFSTPGAYGMGDLLDGIRKTVGESYMG
jgi:hypothetical protein